MKLLVVEDDKKIAQTLEKGLSQSGFEVQTAHTGEDAFFLLSSNNYDAVILDWMLPGRSGVEVLRLVRSQHDRTPVLILTAKDTLEDKVEGLEAGADDYLVKPFEFPELTARVRSLLRREEWRLQTHRLELGDLVISIADRTVTRKGQEIELTNREFDLLVYMGRSCNQIVTRDMLTKDVWRIESRATPMDGVIDVHINRLRKKIDSPFSVKMIKTVRGVGFKLEC